VPAVPLLRLAYGSATKQDGKTLGNFNEQIRGVWRERGQSREGPFIVVRPAHPEVPNATGRQAIIPTSTRTPMRTTAQPRTIQRVRDSPNAGTEQPCSGRSASFRVSHLSLNV